MKKEVGSGIGAGSGFGSISQRYGSGDPDPDPHQKCHGSPTLVLIHLPKNSSVHGTG